jgi:hypothetical protein
MNEDVGAGCDEPIGAVGGGAKKGATVGWRGGANGVVGGSWIAGPAGRGCARPTGLCPTTVGGSKL